MSASTLDWSTPALAHTQPWCVSAISTPLVLSHDAPALAQDDLDQARVAPELVGDRLRLGRRRDLGEPDERGPRSWTRSSGSPRAGRGAWSGVPWRRAASRMSGASVVAAPDLADALDADDLVAGRHGQAGAAPAAPGVGEVPARSRAARSRVCAPSREEHAQILRRVDVEPEPGQLARRGRGRGARAAAR